MIPEYESVLAVCDYTKLFWTRCNVLPEHRATLVFARFAIIANYSRCCNAFLDVCNVCDYSSLFLMLQCVTRTSRYSRCVQCLRL